MTWHVLRAAWTLAPSILVGCAALLLGYAVGVRRWRTGRGAAFALGVGVLFLALASPLNALGDDYLFSAHMVQHLVLILVVPPLLLVGIPRRAARRALARPAVRRAERVLGHPAVALGAAIGTLAVWHLPVLYDGALRHELLHVVEHLLFLATFTMFWWPLLAPLPSERLAPAGAVVYLAVAAVGNTVLGVVLTFAGPGLYPAYSRPDDSLGLLHTIRVEWGLSAYADQQLAGALMWAVGMLVMAGALVGQARRLLAASLALSPAERAAAEAERLAALHRYAP